MILSSRLLAKSPDERCGVNSLLYTSPFGHVDNRNQWLILRQQELTYMQAGMKKIKFTIVRILIESDGIRIMWRLIASPGVLASSNCEFYFFNGLQTD